MQASNAIKAQMRVREHDIIVVSNSLLAEPPNCRSRVTVDIDRATPRCHQVFFVVIGAFSLSPRSMSQFMSDGPINPISNPPAEQRQSAQL